MKSKNWALMACVMALYACIAQANECGNGVCELETCTVKTSIVLTKENRPLLNKAVVTIEMDNALFTSNARPSQLLELPCGHAWKVVAESEGVTRTRTFNTVPKTSNDIVIAMDK